MATTEPIVFAPAVDVKLVAYVKGALTETGDTRELQGVFEAVMKGAADAYREWAVAHPEVSHCGWDWSVQFSTTNGINKRRPKKAGR